MKLYIGRKFSGYSVVQDERYPVMWRVRSPDGKLSDMVNLTRAKDAARMMTIREHALGGGAPSLRWE